MSSDYINEVLNGKYKTSLGNSNSTSTKNKKKKKEEDDYINQVLNGTYKSQMSELTKLELPKTTVTTSVTKEEDKPWYESLFDGVKGVGSSLAYGVTEGIGALGTLISKNAPYMLSNEIATERDMADYEKANNITKETRQQIIDKYLKEYGDVDQAASQIATLYNDKAEKLTLVGGLGKFQSPEEYEQLEKEVAELEYVRDLLQQTRGGKPFTDDVGDAMKAGLDWIGVGQFFDDFKEETSVPFDMVRDLGNATVGETAQEFAQEHSFVGGVAQSIGGLIPAMVATALTKNTAVGTAVFTASAKGSYYENYKEKGYSNREAENASTTMAAVELGTEFLGGWLGGINVFKTKSMQELAEKSGLETLRALKIEGLEEATAELANIGIDMNLGEDITLAEAGERVGTAFVSGVALGAVMKGAAVTGSKAQKIANKIKGNEQVTEDELVEALEEVAEQNDTTVEALLEQEITEMQQNTEQEQNIEETEKSEAPQAEISDVPEQSQQVIFPEVEMAENTTVEPNTAIEENIPIETAQNVAESEQNTENVAESEKNEKVANEDGEKWETVYGSNGRQYQRKLVRAAKDQDGNEFRIYILPNNHSELTIKENGQKGARTIKGSRAAITRELGKYWKGQGTFTDIDINNNATENVNNVANAEETIAPIAESEEKKQIQVYNAVRLDEKNANLDAETKPHGLFLSNLYETDFNEFESPFARQYEGGERHHYKVEPKNPLVVKPLVLDNAKYKYRSGNMATMEADASLSALKELVSEQEFTKVSEMSKQELVEYLNNKYSQYDFSNYYDKAELLMAYGSVEARNQGYDAIITERSTDPDTADIDNEIVVLKNDILKTEAEATQDDIAPVETEQKGTPTAEEIDNIIKLKDEGGQKYAKAFYEAQDKYGSTEFYKALNEGYSRVKNGTQTEEIAPVKEADGNKQNRTLYTGSPNTNIQQFRVGGADGSKQTGDRYGRGIYLTTNKATAEGYAGDNGKVYKINADDLKIFDLTDTITKEMKETLANELKDADKQYRNSVLRKLRTEKSFSDFDSAKKFLEEQKAIWNEQDGYYDANKPNIKTVDNKTKTATIEYTDFENLENSLSNLTGEQLYDALKSISTDDFSSFITGNGYDGISFNEDASNKQYVIYKNEDKLNITNNEDIAPTVSEQVEETIAPLQETVSELTEQVKKLTDQIENAALNNATLAENVADTTLDQQVEANNEPTKMVEDTTPDFDDNQRDTSTVESPFENRDIKEVGNRKVKAYMYENPEVKPYFQEAAQYMLGDLKNTIKGERIFNSQLAYEEGIADQNGAFGWVGIARQTTEDIAYLKDNFGYSYAEIEEGLNKIIEDNGLENNAVSKRIEFMLDERLRNGYADVAGMPIPANQDYINLLDEKQISEYNSNRFAEMTDEQLSEELARNTTETVAEPNVEIDTSLSVDENIYRANDIDSLNKIVEIYENKAAKRKQDQLHNLKIQDKLGKIKSVEALEKRVEKINNEYDSFINGLYNLQANRASQLETETTPDIPIVENVSETVAEAPVEETVAPTLQVSEELAPTQETTDSVQQQWNEEGEIVDTETIEKKTKGEIQRQLLEDAGIVKESLDNAKDVSKVLMHNTDPIRLQEIIFGKEIGGKINEAIFQTVKHNTAEKVRFQNKERDEIKELGIKPRSKESAAVQKYGEKQYINEAGETVAYKDAELQAEFPDVETQDKIKHAAKVIRQKYDTYIDMVNAEITKYGYDAIPKRQDYMRHFQELNDVFSRYGLPFNMQSAQANDLPVDINGLTADLKPGKNWFASALRRKGNKTTYDAITGIDGYIEGIGNLIYHTRDIQTLRGFEDYVREMYGQENGFDNLDNLSDGEKAVRIQQIQNNHLGNYAAWLREYTNALAGKKAMADRAVEDIFGRKVYSFLNELKSQVGSNMTGLNIGSALTNPISMTQALAKTNKLATVKGYADTIKNIFIKDNFVEQNDFLTARFGSDLLSPTMWQKMRNAGQIFMTGTDWFASNSITRSKFYELKAKGLSDAEAHKEAGIFAAKILGDRSQGATPTLYNSKMLGLVTQFQLEVNNQLYSQFYDTFADAKQTSKEKGVLKAAAGATFVLGQLAAFQYVYNNLYEAIAGRRPAFDIIAMIATALGLGGDEEEEKKPLGDRLYEAMDMLLDSLPYVSTFTGGGRIPITEALPITELISGEDQYGNEKSRLETLGEALPYYFLPTGYGQLKKTVGGLNMYDDELPVAGSYTDSGNLRFTAEEDAWSKVQAGLFGQWANPNAKAYIDSGFKSIDKENIDELKELGFDSKEYNKYKSGLNEIKNMELPEGEARTPHLFEYIESLNATDKQKGTMIRNLLSEQEQKDVYDKLEMSSKDIIEYYDAKSTISQQVAKYTNDKKLLTLDTESEEYKEAVDGLSSDKKAKIIDTIINANLTDEQKAYLYGKYYSSDKTLEKITSSGVAFNDYLTFSKDSLSLEDTYEKVEYLYNANLTDRTKAVLYETSVLSGFDDEKKYKDYKTAKAAEIDINSWLSYKKQEFKADKDRYGDSISGTKKKKVINYINSLDLSIPQKALLIKTEYETFNDYNYDIVRYVDRLDTTYDAKVVILENIGFKVDNKGNISW